MTVKRTKADLLEEIEQLRAQVDRLKFQKKHLHDRTTHLLEANAAAVQNRVGVYLRDRDLYAVSRNVLEQIVDLDGAVIIDDTDPLNVVLRRTVEPTA